MRNNRLNWNLTYRLGAPMVPGIESKSRFEAYYAEVKGTRSFFVKCSESDFTQFTKLQALRISSGQKGTIDVSCDEPQLWELFEKIFIEIFEMMKVSSKSFQDAYNETVAKYGAFLAEIKYLGKEKQIGLLAELLFLEQLLNIKPNALEFWIDANEDFKVGNKYIEIKATRSKLHKHVINGLNQLTVIPNSCKYLASYLVEDNDFGQTQFSVNLRSQTDMVLGLLSINQRQGFKDKLIDRKYWHDLQGKDYEQFNFTFYQAVFAKVDASFPKLDICSVPTTLHGNIAPDKVNYELNLQSILNIFKPINIDDLKASLFS
jgi:hypothetical protein